jgi:hypothetical protein
MLAIASNNPAYPSLRDVPLGQVDVLGDVMWVGHTLG